MKGSSTLQLPPGIQVYGDTKKRRYSYAVSDRSASAHDVFKQAVSQHGSDCDSVRVNVDVEVINKDDVEYYDPQDAI